MAVEFVREATASPPARALPISGPARVEAIDALRGIALFGVLMVNLITAFRVSFFSQFLPSGIPETGLDELVDRFLSIALDMKAWSLFSLLFGIGLAIQFERLGLRPDRAVLLFRRLAALFVFGLIHLFLIWDGDILTHYAVVGFAVLPLLFAPRWVLGSLSVVLLFLYGLTPLLNLPNLLPQHAWLTQHIAEANVALGSGDYAQVLQFNMREVASIFPFHLYIILRTLGLFALGAWLWRAGLFRTGSREALSGLGIVGVALGILLTLAAEQSGVAAQLAPIVLALGYAGIVLLLAAGNRTRWLVSWAVPIGRTAFSNYLLQSVIFGFVFYGYGLGLFNRLSLSAAFVLGVAVYAAQVAISSLWLRYFQFGPLEWLWRTLMYGTRQPMRRRAGGKLSSLST